MLIDEYFSFGKYEGLSLKEVYQGMNQIDKALIKDFITDKIKGNNRNIIDFPVLNEIIYFEISDTLIRIRSILDDLNGYWKEILESLLRNGNTRYDRIIGNLSLDQLSRLNNYFEREYPIYREGDPGYIQWCIKSIDSFSIPQEDIVELQKFSVTHFIGVEIIHKIEDIYEYKPIIKFEKHEFLPEIIELNKSKL